MEKYPNISPYAYAGQNPVKYIDPDGKDFRLNVYQDENGKWHIDLSTTVYVINGTEEKVKSYNDFVNANIDKLSGKYVDPKTQIEYQINIKIEYKAGDDAKLKELNKENFGNYATTGDNYIEFQEENFRSAYYGRGEIRLGSSKYYSSPVSALHETLHGIGLNDRYKESGGFQDGYEKDIMGGAPHEVNAGRDFEFKDQHYKNIGKSVLEKTKSGSFKKLMGKGKGMYFKHDKSSNTSQPKKE